VKTVLGICSLRLDYPVTVERANRMPVKKTGKDQGVGKGIFLECLMCETMTQWVAMVMDKKLRLWTSSLFFFSIKERLVFRCSSKYLV